MEQDLTVGSVPKKLLRFAFPLLLANLLQSCYSVVDMVVVGRFVGSEGLAAIGSAAMLGYIVQSVCTGVTMGGAVLVAQYAGARDIQNQRETVGTLFSVSALAALAVTAVGLAAYRPVFGLMSLPPEAAPHALGYMRVYCLGTLFVFGYNAVCAVTRGMGDSKSPLWFVAVATGANLLLDLWLVGGLGMGTRGAALATVAAQGLSFGAAVWYLQRKGFLFDFRPGSFRIRRDKCAALLKLGFPTAVQMAALNLSYLLVTGMFNACGVAAAAAAGVGLKVNTLAAMPCWAVGQAVTTMAGQNLGARNLKRVTATARAGLWAAVAASLAMMAFVQLFAGQIVAAFDASPRVLEEGVYYLRVCCGLNAAAYAVMYLLDSFATGVGDPLFAMMNALFQSVALRLFLSWLFSSALGMGYAGLCWGECLSPVLPALLGVRYYLSGRWRSRLPAV